MTVFILVWVGVFGLLIGSFLNVVAYRVPAGLSIVRPASACPGCGNEISARDNVPLLSWLLLRGECRHCSMKISVRYPLVEASTALAFVVAALPFVPRVAATTDPRLLIAGGLELVAFLYLAGISVVLAVIDLDVMRLPDRIVLPAYAVGAGLLGSAGIVRGDITHLGLAAAGAGGAFLFFLLLALVKPGGMGFGDVKLAGALGLFLGYLGVEQLLIGFTAAFLLGGVVGIALIVLKRSSRASRIPFGPWMLAGTWVGVLAGQPLADAYLRLVGLA
jgi:leader peptidase (prepilin peptidase)/N-methyltransferase